MLLDSYGLGFCFRHTHGNVNVIFLPRNYIDEIAYMKPEETLLYNISQRNLYNIGI